MVVSRPSFATSFLVDLIEVLAHRLVQRRMVILDRQDIVSTTVDDLRGDVFLACHGIHGTERGYLGDHEPWFDQPWDLRLPPCTRTKPVLQIFHGLQ